MEPRPGDDDATVAAAVPAVDETAASVSAAAASAAAAGADDPPLPPRVRGGRVVPVPLPPSPATRPTVYLNVYNLTMPSPPPSLVTFTSMLASTGLGLHHSGVQVGTTEYAFGGHCEGGTGVFEVRPRRAPGAEFRESIELGACVYSAAEVKEIVRALGVAWPGAGYNLLSRYVVGQGWWGGGCCAREACSVRPRHSVRVAKWYSEQPARAQCWCAFSCSRPLFLLYGSPSFFSLCASPWMTVRVC